MNYGRWYDKNSASDGDNYTWGEVVWKAARKELLKELRRRRKREVRRVRKD